MPANQSLNILQLVYKPDHLLPLFNCYAKALMLQGHQLTTIFLTGVENKVTTTATHANQVKFCCFSKKHLRTNKYRVSRKIRQIWLQDNYDLAICHRHKPSFVFSLARLGLKQVPMLSVVHALDQYQRMSRQLQARVFYGRQQNKTALVAVSDAVRMNIIEDFHENPPCPVLTIQNIIDQQSVLSTQLNMQDSRQQLGIEADDVVIGHIGRLVTDKGQQYLLSALSSLLQANNAQSATIKLVIIGTGKLESQLKQTAQQLGIGHSVIFAGEISQASRLMPAFDLFVLPSIVEPFGLVLLEAMAARLPIVATRVGSIASIVNPQSRLVAPGNPQQLAQAIQSIIQLAPDQRKTLGNAGYSHLKHHFSESQFQQQLNTAINQVLD